jgi:hypothetical protein
MRGKNIPLDNGADVDLEALIPTLYRTGPAFISEGGVCKAVLLDHDRFMELYEGAHAGAPAPKPTDRLADALNEHVGETLPSLALGEAPAHLVKGVRDAVVKGSLAILDEVLEGWTLAPHEDGSGDFGLYHTCDPASAYARVDATALGDLVRVVRWHRCPPTEKE